MKLSDYPLLRPYVGKPAILDSNLLLLNWCVQFDPSLVKSFKRLNTFRLTDFDLLVEVLKLFPVLRTTPHVLTEVSNLANSLPEWVKQDWSRHFSQQIRVIPEDLTPSVTAAESELIWLGLTDAALATLATTHVVLTIDFPLSNALAGRGLNVINFVHLRSLILE
jgi:hypothetical protein